MEALGHAVAQGRGRSPPLRDEPPLKRQRILACRRCRHRKQKCEDNRPCTNCQKSGDECIPSEPAPRPHIDSDYVKALEERIADLESIDPNKRLDHMSNLGSGQDQSPEADAPNVATQDDHRRTAMTGTYRSRPSESAERANVLEMAESSAGPYPSVLPRHSQPSPMGFLSLHSDSDSEGYYSIPGLITSPSTHRNDCNGIASEKSASVQLDSPRDRIYLSHSLVASVPREVEETLLAAYRERTQAQYPFFHWNTFIEWLSDWKVCPPTENDSRLWQGFFINIVLSTALLVMSLTRIDKSDARTFYKNGIALLPSVLRQPDPVLHAQAYLLLGMHALHSSSTQRILSLASTATRFCVQQQFHLSETEPEPTNPTVRLQNQVRRRCFWSAYILDRLVMSSFDMPPSVSDDMITTKLYADIDDADLPSIAAQTPPDQELPDSPDYTCVSSSLHILQCRRIQSDIAGYTLRWDYKAQFAESLDWRIRILGELESYKSRVQKFSDPHAKGHTSQRWLAMIYHYTLLMLYRPSKESVLGPAGDWSVQASSQACLMFRKSQMDRQIAQAWLGLLVQFQSGITLLYCFWATPVQHRTENYHSPDMFDALRACSNILAIMADKWPKADCLRDVFELLAREIPLVYGPKGPPIRISDSASAAIQGKLPKVRALVVHRSILRMIAEMVSDDFPQYNQLISSRMPESSELSNSQTRDGALNRQIDSASLGSLAFEMPFSANQLYGLPLGNDSSGQHQRRSLFATHRGLTLHKFQFGSPGFDIHLESSLLPGDPILSDKRYTELVTAEDILSHRTICMGKFASQLGGYA
ncbi:Fc.00g048160.m01.CDS01 [Cosmosporella sp. VM-42]